MKVNLMDCCYPMMDAVDPKMTAVKNYEMDSDRPQLMDDARLERKNSNKPLDTGLVMRQPL